MHIVFSNIGQIEVIDIGHLRNVDAARGDVSGHKNLGLARFELGYSPVALALALVAMNGRRRMPVRRQVPGHLVGTMLGAAEQDHPAEPRIGQQ